MSSVSSDEYGIRRRVCCNVIATCEEVTHVNPNTRCSEAAGILVHDGLAFGANLEGFYL